MKIIFVRHAHADWPAWNGADRDRPLTPKGRKQASLLGKFLRNAGVTPDAIFSSPLPRASQTAEIVAGCLGVESTEDSALKPGFDAVKLAALLKKKPGGEVMIAGHEPDFSATIEQL